MAFYRPHRQVSRWLSGWLLLWALAAPAFPSNGSPDSRRWHWSNPQPHGNNIADTAYRTNAYYVQVTDHGRLYTSTDRIRWEAQETGTYKALRGAAFLGQRLIVSGEAGLILWADDPQEIHRLELGTGDWLESVAASTNRAVAVGDQGAVYTSDDGANWTQRASGTATWFRGVAWGGGRFVAVGEAGTICTSPDGVVWTIQSVANNPKVDLNRVAWTGSGFVVAGDATSIGGATIITGSASGTAWSRVTVGGTAGDLLATAAAPGAKLVVGDLEVRLDAGSGGLQWSNLAGEAIPGVPPPAVYLSALWDGSRFLLGGRTGQTVTGNPNASPDTPFLWSDYPTVTRQWLFDLTTATATATNITPIPGEQGAVNYVATPVTNRFFVAAGDRSRLLQSDTGVTWEASLAPINALNRTYLGVGGNARGLVAVGSEGTVSFSPSAYVALITTNVLTLDSPDGPTNRFVTVTNQVNTLGLAWYGMTAPTTNDLQAVCATEDLYVTGGTRGFLATSPDGTNWTARASGTTSFITGLTAWPGGFVAVGDHGTVLTSPDATTWNPQSSGTTDWLYRVRFAGGLLLALGEHGTLLTSSDAVRWTAQNSGVTNWLNDVTFAAGTWYAVGNQGTLLTSTNSLEWQRDNALITGKSLYGVAALNNRLVTVGIEGIILRARIEPATAPVTIAEFPRRPEQKLFLFSGEPDQRFRLDRGTALGNWQPGPELEITDPSGVLLFYDPTPNGSETQFFSAPGLP